MDNKIFIQESCPRDGWQNHKAFIPTEVKLKYIEKMLQSGAKSLEVTSFVNPKIMPQMADAAEVFAAVKPMAKAFGCKMSALALNQKGAERAAEAGTDILAFVLSASDEHNLRNSHRSLKESMEIFKALAKVDYGVEKVLCIACFFGSPFGDVISRDRMRWLIEEAQSVGINKFGLADTAGICNPKHMREALTFVKTLVPSENVGIHLHDTYGMGLANAYVAIEEGFRHFDSSLAGMGGCPFAPGAKGNVSTEDMVYMCQSLGFSTDCNLEKLVAVSEEMCTEINANNGSCVCAALKCHK